MSTLLTRIAPHTARRAATVLAALALLGCGGAPEVVDYGSSDSATGGGAKDDSGWLGSDTFEVNAVLHGAAYQLAQGEWEDLATDPELQAKLVDLQLKYAKTKAESLGWRLNQLAETVEVARVETDEDGGVRVEYTAVTDLLGKYKGWLPRLEDIDPREFVAQVPVAPVSFSSATMAACSEVDGGHSVRDYNFHYYFAPEKEGCELALTELAFEIVEVFERPVVYPEYDQLLQQLDETTFGFRAALVPNRGDDDPLSRFKVHARMLEDELGLAGEDSEDGAYRRYTWSQGNVSIVIDLFDPTDVPWMTGFAGSFREKLGSYTLVHYNGHSSYGSKHLLDEPESFSDAYQIISMHSCQSYAYYTRQIFRAKETVEDPTGHALADVLATGKSSYPSGAPPTLRVLLQSLMAGMVAVAEGRPADAPDWIKISERISDSTWGDIMYGVAGVRSNAWTPDRVE